MNILVLNGSPKGKTSATLHTALYLEALHTEHTFEYLPVAVRIKSYEKDFAPARAALERADLVLFCYPVYTFLAPCQLHRFVELIKADGGDLSGKFASQPADAFVYAFSVRDHSAGALFKCFDDRQFCNGHRAVTQGKPVAYLIRGDYRSEPNLRMVLEARAEVGGNYLAGVAADEGGAAEVAALAAGLAFALERDLSRPANFYGVGGSKIFRDLIYVMRGMMKADHKFYKAHGAYDFPQKQKMRMLQMQLVGALLAVPAVQKQAKGKMTEAIVGPYRKVVEAAKAQNGKGAKE